MYRTEADLSPDERRRAIQGGERASKLSGRGALREFKRMGVRQAAALSVGDGAPPPAADLTLAGNDITIANERLQNLL